MGTVANCGDRVLRKLRDTDKSLVEESDILFSINLAIDLIHAHLVSIESNLVLKHSTLILQENVTEYSFASGTWVLMPRDSIWIDGNQDYLTQVSEASRAGLGYPFDEHDFTAESGYWVASASGTNEYYYVASDGGDPDLAKPIAMLLSTSSLTEGTVGSLNDHEWDFGDNDSLGFSTIYLRDDTGDPDSLTGTFKAFIPSKGEPDYYYITDDPKIGFIPCPDDTYFAHIYYFQPSTSYHVGTYNTDDLPFENIWNRVIEQLVLADQKDALEISAAFEMQIGSSAWTQAMNMTYMRGRRRRMSVDNFFSIPGV